MDTNLKNRIIAYEKEKSKQERIMKKHYQILTIYRRDIRCLENDKNDNETISYFKQDMERLEKQGASHNISAKEFREKEFKLKKEREEIEKELANCFFKEFKGLTQKQLKDIGDLFLVLSCLGGKKNNED